MLYPLNWRTAFFGSISIFIYVAVYTPLKPEPHYQFLWVLSWAILFMLGWVAYTNYFGVEPGVLFMLQIFGISSFLNIAWMLDEDYKSRLHARNSERSRHCLPNYGLYPVDAVDFFTALYPLHWCLNLSIYGAVAVAIVGLAVVFAEI